MNINRLRCYFTFLLVCACSGAFALPVSENDDIFAGKISLSVAQLIDFLKNSGKSGKPIQKAIGEQIQKAFDEKGILIHENRLVMAVPSPASSKDISCAYSAILGAAPIKVSTRAFTGTFELWKNTKVNLAISPIDNTATGQHVGININFDYNSRYSGSTVARLHLASLVSFCREIDSKTDTVKIAGNISGNFNLDVGLTLDNDNTSKIVSVIRKATLSSSISTLDIQASYSLGRIFSPGPKKVLEELIEYMVRKSIRDKINGFVTKQNEKLAANFNKTDFFTHQKIYEMRYGLQLLYDLGAPLWASKVIQDNFETLVIHVLTGNKAALNDFLYGPIACTAATGLRANMNLAVNLYSNDTGSCRRIDPMVSVPTNYFTDFQCKSPIDFKQSVFSQYCATNFKPNPNTVLGNAASWDADVEQPHNEVPNFKSQKWTQAYGTDMKFGVVDMNFRRMPLMKKIRYKTTQKTTSKGIEQCELEMRVYRSVFNRKLRPLLAIHGGSWQWRGLGFSGLESMISHFTDNGFVVFAPFYRLTGSQDSVEACNGASWADIVEDVESALGFVQTYGPQLGSAGGKISVWGQSAGAHLSAYLAINHPQAISAGLLLYPPTDMADYIRNARVGAKYEPFIEHAGILERFLGIKDILSLTEPYPAAVTNNSFPEKVNLNTPPLYIIHGISDTLVPSHQSVRLCNAFTGSSYDIGPALDDGGDPTLGIYSRYYRCGNSRLTLVHESDHMMDACVGGALCPAGGPQSQKAVADSIRTGIVFLRLNTP